MYAEDNSKTEKTMIDRRPNLLGRYQTKDEKAVYEASGRWLNVATIVRYNLGGNREYVLGNSQILEFADMRYHRRTTEFTVEQVRQEMLLTGMVVGNLKRTILPEVYAANNHDEDRGDKCYLDVNDWHHRRVTNPSGRFAIKASEFIGLGVYADEHNHREVPLIEHFQCIETEKFENRPVTPQFFIEDPRSTMKMYCVNKGNYIPVTEISLPYTPYTPLEKNTQYNRIYSDRELADTISRLYRKKKIYMGMRSFHPQNMIEDERIPVSYSGNLYPIWGTVPFSIDIGYATMDTNGLTAAYNLLVGPSEVTFARKPVTVKPNYPLTFEDIHEAEQAAAMV